jgi:hypothetical protein
MDLDQLLLSEPTLDQLLLSEPTRLVPLCHGAHTAEELNRTRPVPPRETLTCQRAPVFNRVSAYEADVCIGMPPLRWCIDSDIHIGTASEMRKTYAGTTATPLQNICWHHRYTSAKHMLAPPLHLCTAPNTACCRSSLVRTTQHCTALPSQSIRHCLHAPVPQLLTSLRHCLHAPVPQLLTSLRHCLHAPVPQL